MGNAVRPAELRGDPGGALECHTENCPKDGVVRVTPSSGLTVWFCRTCLDAEAGG